MDRDHANMKAALNADYGKRTDDDLDEDLRARYQGGRYATTDSVTRVVSASVLAMYAVDTQVYFKNELGFKTVMPIEAWHEAGDPQVIVVNTIITRF